MNYGVVKLPSGFQFLVRYTPSIDVWTIEKLLKYGTGQLEEDFCYYGQRSNKWSPVYTHFHQYIEQLENPNVIFKELL